MVHRDRNPGFSGTNFGAPEGIEPQGLKGARDIKVTCVLPICFQLYASPELEESARDLIANTLL